LSAEAALAREKVTRPTLLTVGMYLALPFGAIFLLLLLLAPFNAGNYTINGESVTGIEFLRRAGVMFGVESVAALAAAYGIWKERAWSRWAIVFFWVAQIGGVLGFGWADSGLNGVASGLASILLSLVAVGWYLFGKENVVEYYQALERSEAAEAARLAANKGDGV
jgi:uncharacterized membrane protein YtjA (UPF0391 family)